MKGKKILIILLIIYAFYSHLLIGAQTIKEFEAEIEKETKELEERKNKIAKNEAEVAEIKKNIISIEQRIKQMETEIANLEKEIEESNKQIEKKSEESKQIMTYYQIANGENAYLEYAFGATTITDMIYRMSIVEQLTEYNKQIMNELQELIRKNNARKKELTSKKEEQTKLKKDLQKEKERIDEDTASLKAGMPSIEERIKSNKEQRDNLKNMGCRDDEDIQACIYRKMQVEGSLPSTNGFYRPMEHGYITQGYGGYGGHLGMDFGSNNKSIDLYPVANGQVTATYYDNYGALVVKIRHNHNGRFIYSTYAHLRNFAVKSGQYVSYKTTFGKMGNTGYSFGPHLHLEITTCDWKSEGGGCTWATYQKSTRNPASYIELPSKWNNR